MLCQEKEKRQPAVVRAGVLTGERNRKNDAIFASNGCKKKRESAIRQKDGELDKNRQAGIKSVEESLCVFPSCKRETDALPYNYCFKTSEFG